MKKILMMMACCLMLVGCGEEEVKESKIDVGDGASIFNENEGRIDVSVKIIPYNKIKYNDEEFSLQSVDLYSIRSKSGHGYIPYIVIKYDLNTLSEDALYWIMKDWSSNELLKEFETHVYIGSEKNNLVHESMKEVSSWNDSGIVTHIFSIGDEYKYDFSDMEISLYSDIKQDETYKYENKEGEESELNKEISYSWYINNSYGLEMPILNESDMPDDIKNKIGIKIKGKDTSDNKENKSEGVTEEQSEQSIHDEGLEEQPEESGESRIPTTGERNALQSAKSYLNFMAFSYSGLIEQVESEGYSHSEAVYGVDNCGADWNEQAVKSAKSYLEFMSFSRTGLIEQLEADGFTHEQAVYGAEQNGY